MDQYLKKKAQEENYESTSKTSCILDDVELGYKRHREKFLAKLRDYMFFCSNANRWKEISMLPSVFSWFT